MQNFTLSNNVILRRGCRAENTTAKVRVNSELSESFVIEPGVMQGGVSSPV